MPDDGFGQLVMLKLLSFKRFARRKRARRCHNSYLTLLLRAKIFYESWIS